MCSWTPSNTAVTVLRVTQWKNFRKHFEELLVGRLKRLAFPLKRVKQAGQLRGAYLFKMFIEAFREKIAFH